MGTKTALITGINGQDGSYLAELLLEKNYSVFGLGREGKAVNPWIQELVHNQGLEIVKGDLEDSKSIQAALQKTKPDEVYNLAALSSVHFSFKEPELVANINALGVLRLLEAVRQKRPQARFFQASSSEMFGTVPESPQNEKTPFHPRSPYGIAKVYAHQMTQNYRETYKIFACSGILYNHESPRRSEEFVTQKIIRGAVRIALGGQKELKLGNLDARRDWGYALDYVKAMWLMLQQKEPEDFVIGSGETHSVRELVNTAFALVGIADWEKKVGIDPAFFRPVDPTLLCANPAKAEKKLGWKRTVDFKQLIQMIFEADWEEEKRKK